MATGKDEPGVTYTFNDELHFQQWNGCTRHPSTLPSGIMYAAAPASDDEEQAPSLGEGDWEGEESSEESSDSSTYSPDIFWSFDNPHGLGYNSGSSVATGQNIVDGGDSRSTTVQNAGDTTG